MGVFRLTNCGYTSPIRTGGLPQSSADMNDDDLSLHSEHTSNYLQNNPAPAQSQALSQGQSQTSFGSTQLLGPVRSEEVYAVMTGSAGLRSLMPQHTPMQPMRDPY